MPVFSRCAKFGLHSNTTRPTKISINIKTFQCKTHTNNETKKNQSLFQKISSSSIIQYLFKKEFQPIQINNIRATVGVVTITSTLSVASLMYPDQILDFACNEIKLWNGEYYRIFTAPFIHQHYSMGLTNSIALVLTGMRFESAYGLWIFLLVLFTSALVSLLFAVDTSVQVVWDKITRREPLSTSKYLARDRNVTGIFGGAMGLLSFIGARFLLGHKTPFIQPYPVSSMLPAGLLLFMCLPSYSLAYDRYTRYDQYAGAVTGALLGIIYHYKGSMNCMRAGSFIMGLVLSFLIYPMIPLNYKYHTYHGVKSLSEGKYDDAIKHFQNYIFARGKSDMWGTLLFSIAASQDVKTWDQSKKLAAYVKTDAAYKKLNLQNNDVRTQMASPLRTENVYKSTTDDKLDAILQKIPVEWSFLDGNYATRVFEYLWLHQTPSEKTGVNDLVRPIFRDPAAVETSIMADNRRRSQRAREAKKPEL